MRGTAHQRCDQLASIIVRFHCKNLAESQTVRRNYLVTQPADERNCGWIKISTLTLGKQGNRAQDLYLLGYNCCCQNVWNQPAQSLCNKIAGRDFDSKVICYLPIALAYCKWLSENTKSKTRIWHLCIPFSLQPVFLNKYYKYGKRCSTVKVIPVAHHFGYDQ